MPSMILEEHMASLHQVGVPEHALKLKVGALAMVTCNLNPDLGRVCILHVSTHAVKARTLDAARRIVFVPRLKFDLPLPNSHLRVTRKQFPLRLAYCLTGNKSQGKTLQCVGADLRDSVLSPGSRMARRTSLRVASPLHINLVCWCTLIALCVGVMAPIWLS